jgi:PadR family transcriptional regulator, regulatory protein PadR
MQDLFRETFRGFIRIHLLHHAAEAPIFGVEMMEELRRHGYAMGPGTLYPILHGLEEAGLLRSTSQVVNGKVRRYYVCTPRGRKALDKLKVRLKELTAEVLEEHAHHEHGHRAPVPARGNGRPAPRATR